MTQIPVDVHFKLISTRDVDIFDHFGDILPKTSLPLFSFIVSAIIDLILVKIGEPLEINLCITATLVVLDTAVLARPALWGCTPQMFDQRGT